MSPQLHGLSNLKHRSRLRSGFFSENFLDFGGFVSDFTKLRWLREQLSSTVNGGREERNSSMTQLYIADPLHAKADTPRGGVARV